MPGPGADWSSAAVAPSIRAHGPAGHATRLGAGTAGGRYAARSADLTRPCRCGTLRACRCPLSVSGQARGPATIAANMLDQLPLTISVINTLRCHRTAPFTLAVRQRRWVRAQACTSGPPPPPPVADHSDCPSYSDSVQWTRCLRNPDPQCPPPATPPFTPNLSMPAP